MSELDELRERVAALENLVREQGNVLAREAELRAAVDRDQADMGSKVSATHHLVQALAITQSDHGDKLTKIENWQRRHDGRLNRIEEMLEQLLRRE